MNDKLVKLQLLGCGVLAVILAIEWGYSRYAAQQLQSMLNKQIDSDYQSDELPSLDLPRESAEHYSTIVERPLFIEGRKPVVENTKAETPETADAGQIDDWSLIGIYNKDKKPYALFSKLNENKKYLKLNEEQNISGWLLKEIQPDRVVLQQGEQQKSVMLRKPRQTSKASTSGNKHPAAAPTAPTRAPVPPENNHSPENTNDDS